MPCGFTGQQPSGYDASIEVSCLLLLYLLMVSSQSILMRNKRKHTGGNQAIWHDEGARQLVHEQQRRTANGTVSAIPTS